ncbi:MAG: acyltransferase [Muribaculaceae bacterium]|nr:acyltransferase [Muribaculaceae bacterium]
MINSLQSLRGVFAIMIFLSHFNLTDDGVRAFYPGGTMGVEFFIMLSGFVMCAGYEKIVELRSISYKDFMLRRLIRLYPLHILCLVVWLILHNAETGRVGLLANTLMLQAWVPDVDVFYGCNTPSWCLSVFMFLYAVFPALIMFYYRQPRRAAGVICAAVILFVGYIILIPTDNNDMEVWLSRILPPVRLIDFAIGIALWQIYRAVREHRTVERFRRSSVGVKTVVELVAVGLYVVGSMFAEELSPKWCSELVWWLPTAFALMLFSLTDKAGGMIGRLLESRPLVAFGDASFCFYLLHLLVVRAVYRFTYHFGITQSHPVMLWITLAVTIAVSLAVNRYFDKPVGRRLRRFLKS